MRRQDQTEVLVVGAGPVGMFGALLLAGSGIGVKIIDTEPCTAGHSYACALHPNSLKLLDQAGIATEALQLGHRIDSIAFYEGRSRQAELKLCELPTQFPFVLVLPQSALEDLLERSLHREHMSVNWTHRLADFAADNQAVTATIDKLGETAKGYIVAEWEGVVEKKLHTNAAFIVGADGHNSLVRRRLNIEYEQCGHPEFFVVYEFECDRKIDPEMRVVVNDITTSVMWPLSDTKCRWAFQIVRAELLDEFPGKDRSPLVMEEAPSENDSRHQLQRLLRARAPWFEANVEQLLWSTQVKFEHQLAREFGRNRCWLAGDAAHQTGPVAMQSMNVGLQESADLAAVLKKILREHASLDSLETYSRNRRAEWQRLLVPNRVLKTTAQAEPWIKQRCATIASCVPASGTDLTRLLNQLGLSFE